MSASTILSLIKDQKIRVKSEAEKYWRTGAFENVLEQRQVLNWPPKMFEAIYLKRATNLCLLETLEICCLAVVSV